MQAMRACLLLLVAACSSGVDVRGGAGDPRYDFKALKTYSWMPLESTGDPRIDEPALEARVRSCVNEDLAAKGYRLVPEAGGAAGEKPEPADFLVGYRAVLGTERSVQQHDTYEGIWTEQRTPHADHPNGSTVDKVDTEGTLVLRIFDRKSRNLVWEAAADAEISARPGLLDPTREDQVRAAIRKMLERFPP